MYRTAPPPGDVVELALSTCANHADKAPKKRFAYLSTDATYGCGWFRDDLAGKQPTIIAIMSLPSASRCAQAEMVGTDIWTLNFRFSPKLQMVV